MSDAELEFMKLEGCGNSFVVLQAERSAPADYPQLSRAVCRPDIGIGSDGLLVVAPGQSTNFEVTMLNPDGSPMGMCGNGIRCVCRFIILQGLARPETRSLSFIVEGRRISCDLLSEARQVRVNMGHPSFDPRKIPLGRDQEMVNAPLMIEGTQFLVTAVSMGNPHCVLFVSDLDGVDLRRLGPSFEHHPAFPRRTNVEFVTVVDRERLKVIVWERGAGVTMACGTGACATVVAGARLGLCERSAAVELPGGEVAVEWKEDSDEVYLSGPAREICKGRLTETFLRAAAGGPPGSA